MEGLWMEGCWMEGCWDTDTISFNLWILWHILIIFASCILF